MKVYFTGSLHNKDVDKSLYVRMVERIKKQGHTVNMPILDVTPEELDRQPVEERSKYYSTLKNYIRKADVVVAEVSYPSTINIGHEISLALDMGKPIVALYQPGREPGVLAGVNSDRFILLEYKTDDLAEVLQYGLEEADEQMDVRFNFFISPRIENYLDAISKLKRLPRAVYLRRLIEEDMKNNPEYNG